jgi:DNA-binding winged helix-turn-helix (wHTH) protein
VLITTEFPPFELDRVNQCLWRKTEAGQRHEVILTPKAYAVLHYLVEHAGRLVTHDELLESLWPDTFVQPEVLKNHILQIRNALGDQPKDPAFIKTLPRRGYQFIARVSDGGSMALRAPAMASTILVGRDQSLCELQDCLRLAMNGQRQTVFITGEPGIGKTALADEFQGRAAAATNGLRIARGQCIEGYGGKEPYYPMLEALGQLCSATGGDSLVQLLASQAPTWLVQFPMLMKADQPDTLRREVLGATRERMMREIGELLEMFTAKTPLLLIFEDLHWVDYSTVDLISALSRRRGHCRLMLVGTYRSVDVTLSGHPLHTLKQDLLVHRLCHEIPLEPLSETEVAAYLDNASSGHDLPKGLAELIYRHTEGNPLFMVAALDHMTKRGLLSRERDGWRVNLPLEELDIQVPESLRQLIEVQIDRLSREEQYALEVASITLAGAAANINAVAANLDPERFDEVCEELARRHHILRPAGSQQCEDGTISQQYEFVHALYREVLYRRMSNGRREKLHRSIGNRLEALNADRMDEAAPELAHHFEASCDWVRAVKYLRLVAETAGRRYAPGESTRVLRHALELSAKMPVNERAVNETEILEKLAMIYVVSFDMRCIESYEALLSKATEHNLVNVEIRALIDMAYPLSWTSTDRCLKAVERALQLGDAHADPLMRARTRASCMVRRVWASGWSASDAEECRKALSEIRAACSPIVLSWHLLDCNFMQWCSSEYRLAYQETLDNLKVLPEEFQHNPYLSISYWLSQFILPWSLLFLGKWGEALQVIKKGIALGITNGDQYRGQTLLLYQAWVHLQAMDYDGVVSICESILPSLTHPSRTPWSRFCRALLGSAEVAKGHPEKAFAHLSELRNEINLNMVIFDWYCELLLESGLTELWIAKGDMVRARAEAERFLKTAQRTAEHTWQALAWEVNARIAIAQDELQVAGDCIDQAMSALDGFEAPLAEWRVHATAAGYNASAGDTIRAKEHLESSRATIHKLADSLAEEPALRRIFLSTPQVREILGTPSGNEEAGSAMGIRQ